MCDSHRKQGTLWLSFAEATREHLFSQLRLSRQSGKGAGVRTIVGCGQDDCGPMRERQPIEANIEPRVTSFKQPIPRAVGNVVISHSSMPRFAAHYRLNSDIERRSEMCHDRTAPRSDVWQS